MDTPSDPGSSPARSARGSTPGRGGMVPTRRLTPTEPEALFAGWLARAMAGRPRAHPLDDSTRIESAWGGALPPDLRAVLRARDHTDLSAPLGPLSLEDAAVHAAIPALERPFEHACGARTDLLARLVGGLVRIGRLRSGADVVAYAHGGRERAEVLALEPSTRRTTVLADGVAALVAMAYASEVGRDVDPRLMEALGPRVCPAHDFAPLYPHLPLSLAPDAGAGAMLARSRWLLALLGHADGGDPAQAALRWVEQAGSFPAFLSAARSPMLRDVPMVALHWLFALWAFGQLERLAVAIEITRGSRSPVVRDAARVVGELAEGRRALGVMGDLWSAREAFRDAAYALDPRAVPR